MCCGSPTQKVVSTKVWLNPTNGQLVREESTLEMQDPYNVNWNLLNTVCFGVFDYFIFYISNESSLGKLGNNFGFNQPTFASFALGFRTVFPSFISINYEM